MNIVVLGSGVVGVTTAYYLAKSGHEVTVIDRQASPAMETSFANAGQISPGYSAPWAAPGVPFKAIKWMMQDLAPLRIKPMANPAFLKWMFQMISNCTQDAYQINKSRMLRVAEYSSECIEQITQDHNLQYDHRNGGTLQVFRTDKQADSAQADMRILEECGVEFESLDVAGCVAREPALDHVKSKLVGGLRLPGDGTGDCFKFTQGLADVCESMGVKFRFNTEIVGLEHAGNQITGVKIASGERVVADCYVVAMGSYSPLLLKPLDIHLPIYPVKGFSLTLPLLDESRAPVSTVMDETYKVGVTRFDDRIRVGGTAELTGFDLSLPADRRRNADFVVTDLFRGCGDLKKAEFWTGLRPMTPDGTPILGETRFPNLMLNTGHGTLGWTMGAGSAKYVSDIINGQKPDIDPSGLSVDRYR
jgi:D-amino-acid dehydrogenase